jgi:hypothetical protein
MANVAATTAIPFAMDAFMRLFVLEVAMVENKGGVDRKSVYIFDAVTSIPGVNPAGVPARRSPSAEGRQWT